MDGLLESTHLASTLIMVGVIWTVQTVVYPQFLATSPSHFGVYHAGHMRRIGPLVMTVMSVELVATVIILARATPSAGFLAAAGFLAINWISTALIHAPLHGRLAKGFDRDLVSSLIRTNWIRTVSWTARAALILPEALGSPA